ncbi:hypothetical protein PIB30_020324 [Stylosanthes scabra]|uniref:DUF4283 domain-containing protein n=1 Tax=Stylosanthes scabra TaxID=79078 RepID=A0ABU6X6N5_9FABA|nr:hypothetical protein [Stylosanthes scabra]
MNLDEWQGPGEVECMDVGPYRWLITFSSTKIRDEAMECQLFHSLFDEIRSHWNVFWSLSRSVWIEVMRMPIPLWCRENFEKIAKLWGKPSSSEEFLSPSLVVEMTVENEQILTNSNRHNLKLQNVEVSLINAIIDCIWNIVQLNNNEEVSGGVELAVSRLGVSNGPARPAQPILAVWKLNLAPPNGGGPARWSSVHLTPLLAAHVKKVKRVHLTLARFLLVSGPTRRIESATSPAIATVLPILTPPGVIVNEVGSAGPCVGTVEENSQNGETLYRINLDAFTGNHDCSDARMWYDEYTTNGDLRGLLKNGESVLSKESESAEEENAIEAFEAKKLCERGGLFFYCSEEEEVLARLADRKVEGKKRAYLGQGSRSRQGKLRTSKGER